ncbi:MAG: hypothetical protein ABL997_17185 [Planctomycetota bacterium]
MFYDDDADLDERAPVVAGIGGRSLVSWLDVDSSGLGVVRSRFVDANGLVSPLSTRVPGSPGLPPGELSMASVGNRVAMAWSFGPGAGVFAEIYDQNGTRLGTRLTLSATSGGKPAVGAAPHGFYIAWQNGGFYGSPVDLNGVVAVPQGAMLAPIGATYLPALAVAFDGTDWLVAYPAPPSVLAVRVAQNGTVGATTTVTTSPTQLVVSVTDIAAVASSASVILLWTDSRLGLENLDPADVFGAAVSASSVTAAAPITVSVPAQVNAKIAEIAPLGHLVVYEQQTSGVTKIMTRLVDPQGNPVFAQPFEVAVGDRRISSPAVAWNGTEYLVTWGRIQTTSTNGPPPLIEARRCDVLGSPIDPAPFTVMEGAGPTVAAVGSTFLVAGLYRHLVLQYQPAMRCRRVDGPSGALLDPAPRNILVGAGGGAKMVGFADRWLVVFGPVTAAFVLADGTPQPVFFAGTTGQAPGPRLALCPEPNGAGACLVFEHQRSNQFRTDVHVRRLLADGSSLDPGDGVPVGAGIQAELRPAVAALDDGYLCLYADHRDSPEIEPGLGDVFAARVPFVGAPLDAAGLPILDTVVAEGGVAVMRTDRGTALVVASAMAPGFSTHRLQLSQYRSSAVTPWSVLGSGLSGAYGVPEIRGFGTLQPGAYTEVSIFSAATSSPAVTGLGVAVAGIPLFGGVLIPQPLVILDHQTDASGTSLVSFAWPPGLSGIDLYAQSWIFDPFAVQSFAATVGLRGRAP